MVEKAPNICRRLLFFKQFKSLQQQIGIEFRMTNKTFTLLKWLITQVFTIGRVINSHYASQIETASVNVSSNEDDPLDEHPFVLPGQKMLDFHSLRVKNGVLPTNIRPGPKVIKLFLSAIYEFS